MLRTFQTDTIFDWALVPSAPCCDECATEDKEFKEVEHPRGQPENAGQFTSGGSGKASAHLEPAHHDRNQWPEHIKALRLPPAWSNVQVSPDPKTPLQAVGQDAKGRKQYVYNADFAQSQAEAKFARIKELDRKFASIQAQNEKNKTSKDPVTREHADAASLIMGMGIRPGSESDTGAEHESYGATTLLGNHVVRKGKQVNLQFTPGKKHGEMIDLPVEDTKLALMLIARAHAAGHNGQLFPNVSASSLLDYMHTFDGGGFKTKDMRTLLGTRTAMAEIAKMDTPSSATGYKKAVKAVATQVSQRLGNTPTVALQSYINPTVFAEWRHAAGV